MPIMHDSKYGERWKFNPIKKWEEIRKKNMSLHHAPFISVEKLAVVVAAMCVCSRK